MFKSARLKLTAWYLLIIMSISLFFSAIIYRGVTAEFQRRLHRIEQRFPGFQPNRPRPMFVEDLDLVKKRVFFILLYTNGAILLFSGLAGYFLAGKTLKPIELAMEEQKRFVADASHELRTPLTALKTSMEVALKDKKMSLEDAKKVIKSNLEDLDSLESLSNNLLGLASLQSNGRNIVFSKVDAAEAVKSAYRKILPKALEKKIEVRIQVKKQEILGHKESLEKMILIFLDNAVKYTLNEGKVTVKTRTDKRNLILEIKDTGIGIAKKDLPHIFDRFYRADQSRSKENVPGFGLGLSLAKRIIELHKGFVSVASILSKGTTFTIRLPLKHS